MGVTIEDHTSDVIAAMKQAALRALEVIGGKAEGYAKGLTPTKTGALKNSFTHAVDDEHSKVVVGSNMHYAP